MFFIDLLFELINRKDRIFDPRLNPTYISHIPTPDMWRIMVVEFFFLIVRNFDSNTYVSSYFYRGSNNRKKEIYKLLCAMYLSRVEPHVRITGGSSEATRRERILNRSPNDRRGA